MMKKLRRKFVLINMSLVSLVMLIIFTSICISGYERMRNESYQVMQRALENKSGSERPVLEIGDGPPRKPVPMLPVFSVTVDGDGQVLSNLKENVLISDNVIQEVTDKALASGKTEGMMLNKQLRFLIKDTAEGKKIAFADMSREIEQLTNQIMILLAGGAGGLIAFWAISIFLANLALRPVEKAWEQQKRFVADASHELRTPLTVILANIGILLSHRKDTIEKQYKWVENTQAEASRMKKLVDDLLFLAKLDAVQKPVQQTELNFSDIVWSSLLPFEPIAYEQGIEVSSEIDPDISLNGDAGQLKQLVAILLDNACKYAGQNGKVTLTLKNDKDQALLSVNNTGEPIPIEHLEHVFKRFYRADSSRIRKQGGYGLGLSIAQTIVESHGGGISAESNGQDGTTFIVRIPLG